MSEIWKVGMSQRNAPPVSSVPRAGRFGRRLTPLDAETPSAFTLSNAAQPEPERHAAHPAIPNDIDFAIAGSDMQYVEIELDPGEAIVADNGSMIWKDTAIEFSALLGDGSEQGGLWSKVASAGMNMLAGENMFISEFRHTGSSGKARVAVGGAVPGHIIPIRLEAMGGTLICQRDAFLAAAKGVSISIAFQRKIMTGLFGGEGFIMQRLTGQGWAFLHVGGTLIERQLAAGEEIQVDTGCVAAYEPSIGFDIACAGSFGTGLVGGEGFFLATMRGPGKVWIQTLPFSRLAAETVAAAPSAAPTARRHSSEVDVIGGIQSLTKMF